MRRRLGGCAGRCRCGVGVQRVERSQRARISAAADAPLTLLAATTCDRVRTRLPEIGYAQAGHDPMPSRSRPNTTNAMPPYWLGASRSCNVRWESDTAISGNTALAASTIARDPDSAPAE